MGVSKFLDSLARSSKYTHLVAPQPGRRRQVLLCGHVRHATLEKFVTELLHEDHNNPVQLIVVLDGQKPSPSMQLLLDSDAVGANISFVQGSAQVNKVSGRLRRVCHVAAARLPLV